MSEAARSDGFDRTLQTAADAERVAALLRRAAKASDVSFADQRGLTTLAERYAEYACALRETVAAPDRAPDDQMALL